MEMCTGDSTSRDIQRYFTMFAARRKLKKQKICDARAGQEVALLRQNGRVELYSRSGSYMRTLGSGDVTGVQVSGDTVALTRQNGRVEVYGIDGSYRRTL